ncbi:tRNA (N6-threonylcarbamoyladenosine(37)-N6)-methyltransferase TrmO [Hahella sp. CCB-MM4]|uniref:tRNA (N6-threonylcarbamoyladenosine(37)-N6)-methyltransferase TrmO n=1 Tax=Hahella sp. (strain CCB-MM4) TaxID=1926491 RepID=UPI000B9A53B7|nr:tRNA (N6-threonylcarbamoyladenosine(37)-N6)-methyltransferase TrmO [Hahella sp. CCB-MM4]OZG70513.1 tRNA (N6-threonylcarbamoyladenosine(37)-N6)-methyltransferase TrmO [Hahella sp. CCB-MM4]
MPDQIVLEPIGAIRSCYPEKFGVPRQPGLVKSANAFIHFHPPYSNPECFTGLEAFSHLWVTFQFHKNIDQGWKPRVRPPRLGGNKSLGVFATRAPFRPNGLGLSAVSLIKVHTNEEGVCLEIEGGDFVDGTPVLDIKPYVAYTDALEATSGFAKDKPQAKLPVIFEPKATMFLELQGQGYRNLKDLIIETISLDPRPQYKNSDDKKIYGLALFDLNIKWRVSAGTAYVESIEPGNQ